MNATLSRIESLTGHATIAEARQALADIDAAARSLTASGDHAAAEEAVGDASELRGLIEQAEGPAVNVSFNDDLGAGWL